MALDLKWQSRLPNIELRLLSPVSSTTAHDGRSSSAEFGFRIVERGIEPRVLEIHPSGSGCIDTMNRLLVSLATYNEVGNLRPLVELIRQFAPHAEIVVIDDNSPDGTGQAADALKKDFEGIHVIHRSGKLGLGTAVIEAIRFAINGRFDYLINLDADFSHPPRFIPNLLAGMDHNDVMIGSRYIRGGGVEGEFNLKRRLMSAGINWYARIFLGLNTKDNSGSYRCYRVAKLAQINLDAIRSQGYSFFEEILYWCRKVDCRFGETPILFENRRSGVSKINKTEAIKAVIVIFQLGVGRLLGRHEDRLPTSNQVPSDSP